MIKNIFEINKEISNEEIFETLFKGNGNFKVEKIISTGQITPENEWYDQEWDEWVVLLQGESKILFEQNNETKCLKKGDYLFIKSHEKHRVVYTSLDPPCVWLAIHGENINNN